MTLLCVKLNRSNDLKKRENKMPIPNTRLEFKETMSGYFSLDETEYKNGEQEGKKKENTLAMHANVKISDMEKFINEPLHAAELSGTIDFPPLAMNIPATSGIFNLFKPAQTPDETHMVYELGFEHENTSYYLAGQKIVKDNPGFDLWSGTTTLFTYLHKGTDSTGEIYGAGILKLGVKELIDLVQTITVPDASSNNEKFKTIQAFGSFFLGELWDSYAVSKFSDKRTGSHQEEVTDYDVVVIGSGFGGSVTACRLAQKGYSVCILERGHRWNTEDYPRAVTDNWWWDVDKPASKNGWIDLQMYDSMGVVQGAGVGGGSLIYASVFIDAEPFSFDSGWPKEITFEELKPYYEKTEKIIKPSKLPDGQLTERTKLMKEAADAIGESARFHKVDLAVSFNQDWNYGPDDPFSEENSKKFINAQGIEQGTCNHCGDCDIGCDARAKNTLDVNYIPLAEQHGAVVKPLHLANKITPISTNDKQTGYRVDFDVIDPDAEVLIPGSINAKKVIVAAGTMGTNSLLLSCRDKYGTLPELSNELGKNWSSNGDFLTPATYTDKKILPTRGPTISAAIDFLDGSQNDARFFVEDGGFPDILGNALNSYKDSAFGFAAKSIAESIQNNNPIDNIMPWFGQAVDAADGVISLKRSWVPPFRKKINLDWDIERSESTIQAMVDMHKKLSEATGGEAQVPASWKYLKDLVTPHALGGCKMGTESANGVVNHKGEVFGYPGLYIADGSIFPVSVGLNPSKTIAALAERIAHFIED